VTFVDYDRELEHEVIVIQKTKLSSCAREFSYSSDTELHVFERVEARKGPMYIGFVVHHVARKLLIGGAVATCAGLATKAGRRVARIGIAAIKGGSRAALSEARTQAWR
jgi:hypothetical protein